MVDGIAGSDLLAVIMDLDPDAPRLAPDVWSPAPEPSRVELARYTGEMTIESVTNAVRGGLLALRHPGDALDRVRGVASGITRILAPGRRGGSSLTGPIGPRRRWARTQVSLDDVKTIRTAFGGTVNDVMLTAVTRGLRELLLVRGEPVEGRTITTLVPVSMRAGDARGTLDNRVSAVYARLPIGIEDPVETLTAIREHMNELKASHEIDASAAIVGVGDFVPPVLAAVLARVGRACAGDRADRRHECSRSPSAAVRVRAPDARGLSVRADCRAHPHRGRDLVVLRRRVLRDHRRLAGGA